MSEDVRRQFAPVASNYATSFFHSDPERLQEIVRLCQPQPGDRVLDVACGTGHTALALRPHVAAVTGLDLTAEMLREARRLAAESGGARIGWVQGDAHALPVASGTVDLYTARAAPHHFDDLEQAMREAARVLRPGGRACFIDCSPPPAARDHLHRVEMGRDPSHRLSRTMDEWIGLLESAGLVVESADRRELDWDFDGWMRNMAVPAPRAGELAAWVEAARGVAREQLRPRRVVGRLRHAYWHALIRARRPW